MKTIKYILSLSLFFTCNFSSANSSENVVSIQAQQAELIVADFLLSPKLTSSEISQKADQIVKLIDVDKSIMSMYTLNNKKTFIKNSLALKKVIHEVQTSNPDLMEQIQYRLNILCAQLNGRYQSISQENERTYFTTALVIGGVVSYIIGASRLFKKDASLLIEMSSHNQAVSLEASLRAAAKLTPGVVLSAGLAASTARELESLLSPSEIDYNKFLD